MYDLYEGDARTINPKSQIQKLTEYRPFAANTLIKYRHNEKVSKKVSTMAYSCPLPILKVKKLGSSLKLAQRSWHAIQHAWYDALKTMRRRAPRMGIQYQSTSEPAWRADNSFETDSFRIDSAGA